MTDNAADQILRQAKLRRTPVRAGVIDILQAANAPLAAADILANLPPRTDDVTLYRTLTTIVKKKVVPTELQNWSPRLPGGQGTVAPPAVVHCCRSQCV